MKNSKKHFAMILILMTVLFALSSCKKDKKSDAENFDLTKYYATGAYIPSGGVGSSSFVYCFLPNGITYESSLGGLRSKSGTYTYSDGVLHVGGLTFNIINGSISNSTLPDGITSIHLQKIPETDAFAGKTFKGTVATNGLDNGKSCLIKFTAGKFTVSIDGFAQTGTGADYKLQNNGVATANTGNEGRLHLMTVVDGKMYYSQFNAASNTKYYGLLTQQ